MKNSLKIAALGLGLVLVSLKACSLSNGAIDGEVLDQSTKKPVAGAIVVVTWIGDVSKLVDSGSTCYHVETARTDANGKYHIPGWWSSSVNFSISVRPPSADVYKPGYTRPRIDSTLRSILIAPFVGAKDEYFDSLSAIAGSNSCSGGGTSRRKLSLLYDAMTEENSIAETPSQKQKIDFIRYQAKDVLVGN